MNIVLLVNRDLASTVALNHLLPQISSHCVHILMSDRVGNNNTEKPKALRDLTAVEQGILNLVMSNHFNSREADSIWLTIPDLANKYRFTVGVENQINQEKSIETLSTLAPDLMISIRYGVILKRRVIDIPRQGVINLHSGLLPTYRGVMATFWAMLRGETTIGTTLHYIDDGSIDTGRVIGTTSLNVVPGQSYLDHVLQLYVDGCDLIVDTIAIFERGNSPGTIDQGTEGEYFTFPGESDLHAFAEQGFRLFDLESVLTVYQRFNSHVE